jgi:hypothetical protein
MEEERLASCHHVIGCLVALEAAVDDPNRKAKEPVKIKRPRTAVVHTPTKTMTRSASPVGAMTKRTAIFYG